MIEHASGRIEIETLNDIVAESYASANINLVARAIESWTSFNGLASHCH